MKKDNMVKIPELDQAREFGRYDPCPGSGLLAKQEFAVLQKGCLSIIWGEDMLTMSDLARYIAERSVLELRHGQREFVTVFSLNESEELFLQRFVLGIIGANRFRAQYNLLPSATKNQIQGVYEDVKRRVELSHLRVFDSIGRGIDDIESRLVATCDHVRHSVVIIDSLMQCIPKSAGADEVVWGMIGERLRRLARQYECAIIVLAQTPQAGRDRDEMFRGYGILKGLVDTSLVLKRASKYQLPIRNYAAYDVSTLFSRFGYSDYSDQFIHDDLSGRFEDRVFSDLTKDELCGGRTYRISDERWLDGKPK